MRDYVRLLFESPTLGGVAVTDSYISPNAVPLPDMFAFGDALLEWDWQPKLTSMDGLRTSRPGALVM